MASALSLMHSLYPSPPRASNVEQAGNHQRAVIPMRQHLLMHKRYLRGKHGTNYDILLRSFAPENLLSTLCTKAGLGN
jgi:hypothetical protein